MTPTEKQAFDSLTQKVTALENAQKEVPAPTWAKEAAEYYKDQIAGEGAEEVGTRDFWRVLVIQYRKATGKKG